MIDFTPMRNKEKTLSEITDGLTRADLLSLTNEMVDKQLGLIANATDSDVTFIPTDPAANDTYAAKPEDVNISWTLGHVIVHTTASAEEGAARALTLARGVEVKDRSRYEVPYETVTTIAQCRARLEESRRMRIAMLNAWPDQPHMENLFETRFAGNINPIAVFVMGLSHDDSHLAQIA